jgi:hypothetical protein
MKHYCMPGDFIFAHGPIGFVFILWALTIGIIEYCQYIYAAQWQLLVTIVLIWIQFGLLLFGLIALIIISVWTDKDIRRLSYLGDAHYKDLAAAKESRYDAAIDLGFVSFYFFMTIFCVANVMCYWLGTPVTFLHAGTTPADNQVVLNNPITNGTAFPVITAAVIQQVMFRADIHRTNWQVDFIALALIFAARIIAVILQESWNRIEYANMNGIGANGVQATLIGARQRGGDRSQVELQTVVAGSSVNKKVTDALLATPQLHGLHQ